MKFIKILLLCLVMAVVFSSCAVMKSMGGLAAAVGDITGNDNLSAMGDSVAAFCMEILNGSGQEEAH